MKIISKYKDYYDYLQGVYGIDEKLVLDRRNFDDYKPYKKSCLVIGNKMLEFYNLNGKNYFGDDILSISKEPKYKDKEHKNRIYIDNGMKEWNWDYIDFPHLIDYENKKGCAIYILEKHQILQYPKLQDFGVNKVIPAHDAWIIISNYLSGEISKKEPNVPIGDDILRIQSHGFSLKTSFRKIKF